MLTYSSFDFYTNAYNTYSLIIRRFWSKIHNYSTSRNTVPLAKTFCHISKANIKVHRALPGGELHFTCFECRAERQEVRNDDRTKARDKLESHLQSNKVRNTRTKRNCPCAQFPLRKITMISGERPWLYQHLASSRGKLPSWLIHYPAIFRKVIE